MLARCATFSLLPIVLFGCAAEPTPVDMAANGGAPRGYWYHDSNHPTGNAPSSPQANYNAAHGVWLWPPAANARPR